MTSADSVRVNALRGDVGKHYRQWEIVKVQAMMVSPENFMFVSLRSGIRV